MLQISQKVNNKFIPTKKANFVNYHSKIKKLNYGNKNAIMNPLMYCLQTFLRLKIHQWKTCIYVESINITV